MRAKVAASAISVTVIVAAAQGTALSRAQAVAPAVGTSLGSVSTGSASSAARGSMHNGSTHHARHAKKGQARADASVAGFDAKILLPAGAKNSYGSALNDRGEVAVRIDNAASYVYMHGLGQAPTMVSQNYPGPTGVPNQGVGSYVMSIGYNGQLVGIVHTLTNGWDAQEIVKWQNPTADPVGLQDARRTEYVKAWTNKSGVSLAAWQSDFDGGPWAVVDPAGAVKVTDKYTKYVGLTDDNQVAGHGMAYTKGTGFVQSANGDRQALAALSDDQVAWPDAISTSGKFIAGRSVLPGDNGPEKQLTPVYWDAARKIHAMTNAPADFIPLAVNNSGMVLGSFNNTPNTWAVWVGGKMIYLAKSTTGTKDFAVCTADGLNNNGQIIATLCHPSVGMGGAQRAALLTPRS